MATSKISIASLILKKDNVEASLQKLQLLTNAMYANPELVEELFPGVTDKSKKVSAWDISCVADQLRDYLNVLGDVISKTEVDWPSM